jgi:hypothetical protein
MKAKMKIYLLLLCFIAPIISCELDEIKFKTFDISIIRKMQDTLEMVVSKSLEDSQLYTSNGCVILYKKFFNEITHDQCSFIHDTEALQLQQDIMEQTEASIEYKNSLKEAYEENSWESFSSVTLYKYIAHLNKLGLFYPDRPDDFKSFFELNKSLRSTDGYTLLKASIFLLHTPAQIELNFEKLSWFKADNPFTFNGEIINKLVETNYIQDKNNIKDLRQS